MTVDPTFEQVRGVMAETFELEPEEITLESRLYEDLELDSIDALDMVVRLGELIGRRVDESELKTFRTVHDVVEMVRAARAVGDRAG